MMIIRCVSLVCSFLALLISAKESFTIKRKNEAVFRDRFQVPGSLRVPKGNPGVFCKKFGAEKFSNSNKDCWCPLENATFGYYDSTWTCFGNNALRKGEGCNIQFTSSSSHRGDALWVVKAYKNNTKPYPVNLTTEGSCQINTAASKYKTCAEEWRSLFSSGNLSRFSLVGNKLQVEKSTDENKHLDGALIKLEFSCAKRNQHCLLFKAKGTVKCSVKQPTPSGSPSSVIQPTPTPTTWYSQTSVIISYVPSRPATIAPTALSTCSVKQPTPSRSPSSVIQPTPTPTTWYSQTSVIISYAPSRPATIAPTTAQSIPMPSSSAKVPTVPRRKDKSGSSSKDKKKITFITTSVVAAVLLVIAVVIALILYSRRKRKNESRTGSSGANLAISADSQSENSRSVQMQDVSLMKIKTSTAGSVTNPVYDYGPDDSVKFKSFDAESMPTPLGPPPRPQNDRAVQRKNNTYCFNERPCPDLEREDGLDLDSTPVYDVLEEPNEEGLDCDDSSSPTNEGSFKPDKNLNPCNQPTLSAGRATGDVYQNPVYEESLPYKAPLGKDRSDDLSTSSYKTAQVGSNQAVQSGAPSGGAPCDNTDKYDSAPHPSETEINLLYVAAADARTAQAGLSCAPSDGGVYDNPVFDNTDENDVGETEANPLYSTAQEVSNQLPGSEQRASPDAYQELLRMQQGGDSYQPLTRRKNIHF